MPSFSPSLMPSARLCRIPNGPTRLGPNRICMRPSTFRSIRIAASTVSTRKTKTATALPTTSHHGSCPKPSHFATSIVTTAPTVTRNFWCTADVGGVHRHPDHAVGHVGHLQRQRDRPRLGAHPDQITVRGADLGDGGRRQPHHRPVRGTRQMRFAVLKTAVVQQHPPTRQHRLTGAGLRRIGRRHVRRLGPRAVPHTERGEFVARRRRVAQAEIHTHFVGDHAQHPHVGERTGVPQ